MKKWVDKFKLVDDLCKTCEEVNSKCPFPDNICLNEEDPPNCCSTVKFILDYPAEEDIPKIVVPIAHWIDKTEIICNHNKYSFQCSNCGYAISYKPKENGSDLGNNFCDNCGARIIY